MRPVKVRITCKQTPHQYLGHVTEYSKNLKQTGVDHTLEERYNFGGNINEQEQTCECPNGAPQSLSFGCPS